MSARIPVYFTDDEKARIKRFAQVSGAREMSTRIRMSVLKDLYEFEKQDTNDAPQYHSTTNHARDPFVAGHPVSLAGDFSQLTNDVRAVGGCAFPEEGELPPVGGISFKEGA